MESISEKFIYDRRYWLVTGRDTGQDLGWCEPIRVGLKMAVFDPHLRIKCCDTKLSL